MTENEKKELKNMNEIMPKMYPEQKMQFIAFMEGMAFMANKQEVEQQAEREIVEAAGGKGT